METIKELNMNELEQINGGNTGACFIVGVSSGAVVSACSKEGSSMTDENFGAGAIVCYFLGSGIGGVTKKESAY